MTTRLEYVCLTLAVAIERDMVGPLQTADYLRELIGTVAWIEPTENDTALTKVHAEVGKRFGDLLIGGKS